MVKCGVASAFAGLLVLALVLAQSAAPGLAQTPAAQPPPAAAEKREPPPRVLPPDTVVTRSSKQGDKQLNYAVTAGSLPLLGNKGETTANIFYTAYTIDDTSQQRPVTFVFNGGPGAASAFLHLGAIGPRVVNFTDNGAAALEPIALADNPDSWLDVTDLVFVDPVGTGYSRSTALTAEADRAFFGVDKDATAMVDFVRLYLTRAGRLLAGVFLVGESYGGFRAAYLADRLLSSGIAVRGVVLISPALEFSMLRGNRYSLLPLALVLPSLAVAHWEMRDGASGGLAELGEVEHFARSTYIVHLTAGLADDAEIDGALARYTGLAPEVIKRHHGRVTVRTFTHEHEKRSDTVLSSYDATVSAPVPRGERIRFDPILDRAVAALEPAFTQYVRAELGYRTDLPYKLLNREVSEHWDYGTSPTHQGFAGALDELQKARTQRPALGVLIVHGYTDVVTPYGISRYLIDQLAPIATARPIELRTYRGGHMMYLRPASRQALARDVHDFYGRVAGSP
jgi:carboxypeptidase C (cathepsin A)